MTTSETTSMSVGLTSSIDLNVDAGESFGPWTMGDDEAVLPLVSTVNVACGFHAGDPTTMRVTLERAKAFGLAIGAHPGLADRVGFGRRAISMTPRQVHDDVLYQLSALQGVARSLGLQLSHAKMHGALTSPLGEQHDLAEAMVHAVQDLDMNLPIFVLPASGIHITAVRLNCPIVREGFPERGYLSNGLLAPRSLPGAVINDPVMAARRAVEMVQSGAVTALDGSVVQINPQSLCVHGDNPNVVAIASAIRDALLSAGIDICRV